MSLTTRNSGVSRFIPKETNTPAISHQGISAYYLGYYLACRNMMADRARDEFDKPMRKVWVDSARRWNHLAVNELRELRGKVAMEACK